LTYNLVRKHSSESADSEVAGRKLHAILADWKQQHAEATTSSTLAPAQITKDSESSARSSIYSTSTKDDVVRPASNVKQAIYLLEHKYTQSNLSIESLKDADRLRAKELLSICDDYGFTLYLANLEREVMGQADENDQSHAFSENSDEDEDEEDEDDEKDNSSQYSGYSADTGDSYHRIWDVCDESITLTRVVDVDGLEIFKDIPVEEEDIVQIRPLKRKPNKSEYEGYTGNEGASATHWYKDTVCIMRLNQLMVANSRPGYRPHSE
jgi:hypothetical protein